MVLRTLLLSTVVLCCAATPLVAAEQFTTLQNGLQVALLERPDESLVSVRIYYGAGSGHDPPGKEGLAHLVEHLMFTSAAGFENGGLAEALELKTARNNAGTSPFWVRFYSWCLPSLIGDVLDIEAARMASFEPSPDEFERERSVVLQELAYRDHRSAGDHLMDAMLVAGFENHPMGRESTVESIVAIQPDDARAFHQRFMLPSNAVLVVRGPVDASAILKRVEETFGGIPAGSTEANGQYALPLPVRAGALVDDYDHEGFIVATLYRLPYDTIQDRAQANLFRAFLDAERLEPVFWRIGPEVLVSSFASGRYYLNPERGYRHANPDRDSQRVAELVYEALQRRRRVLGRKDRFESIKSKLVKAVRWNFDHPTASLDRIAEQLLRGRKPLEEKQLVAAIDSLSREAIQDFLVETLDSNTLITGVLHGRDSGREVSAILPGTAGGSSSNPIAPDRLEGLTALEIEPVLDAYAQASTDQLSQLVLENGVPLTYLQIPGARTIHIGGRTSFPYLKDENAGKKPGITNCYEQLLSAGYRETVKSGGRKREPNPNPFGMVIDAGPAEFRFRARSTSEEAEQLVEGIVERLESTSFNLSRWRRILDRGAHELERQMRRPQWGAMNFLTRSVFGPEHPMVNRGAGDPDTFGKLKLKDMENLHRKLRGTGESRMFAAGSLEAVEVELLVKDLARHGSFKSSEKSDLPAPLVGIQGQVFSSFEKSDVQIEIASSARPIGANTIRWEEMELLLEAIRHVLESELRHRRGMVYYVQTSATFGHGCAGIRILTRSTPKAAVDMYKELHTVLIELSRSGFSKEQVLKAKLRLVGRLRVAMNAATSGSDLLGRISRFHNVEEDPVRAVLSVPTSRIDNLVTEFLVGEAYAFAVLGPILEEDIRLFQLTK